MAYKNLAVLGQEAKQWVDCGHGDPTMLELHRRNVELVTNVCLLSSRFVFGVVSLCTKKQPE